MLHITSSAQPGVFNTPTGLCCMSASPLAAVTAVATGETRKQMARHSWGDGHRHCCCPAHIHGAVPGCGRICASFSRAAGGGRHCRIVFLCGATAASPPGRHASTTSCCAGLELGGGLLQCRSAGHCTGAATGVQLYSARPLQTVSRPAPGPPVGPQQRCSQVWRGDVAVHLPPAEIRQPASRCPPGQGGPHR